MLPIAHPVTLDASTFDLPAGASRVLEANLDFMGSFVLGAAFAPGGSVTLTTAELTANPGIVLPPNAALPEVAWKLQDPDGRLILAHHVNPKPGDVDTGSAPFDVPIAMLDRVRDLAGYIRQPWQLTVTNEWPYDFTGLSLSPQIMETIPSSSAAPLVGGVSVTLAAGVPQTLPFALNRLGEIRIDATFLPAGVTPLIELLDPSGAVVATQPPVGSAAPAGSASLVSGPIGLAALHQAQNKGPAWGVRLSSSAACTSVVTAQVYDSITIPSAVLQNRLDAVLGADGTTLSISVEYDPTEDDSYLCLTVNDINVVELFDSVGLLSTLEGLDLQYRTPKGQMTPQAPPQPQPLTASTPYRILELGSFSYTDTVGSWGYHLDNVQTSSIRVTVGGPANDLYCRVSVSVAFADGAVIAFNKLPNLSLSNLSCSFDLVATWVPGTKHIAMVPENPVLTVNVSGDLTKVPGFDGQSMLLGELTGALNTFRDYLTGFTESLFFQFMGGLFDFLPTIQWTNGAFIFQLVAGEEDPVGVLSPYYHPGNAPKTVVSSDPDPTTGKTGLQGTEVLHVVEKPVTRALTATGLASPKPSWQSPNLARIDHIVVLMKENRSFDHILGHLSLTGGRPDVDGLTEAIISSFPAGQQPRPFPLIPVTSTAPADFFPFDPTHDYAPVAREIDNPPSGPPMHGFIPQFIVDVPWLALSMEARVAAKIDPNVINFQPDAIMGYHTPATVPYYSSLAQAYTVCDRWFSSHPGPTFPNRFFFLAGKLDTYRSGEPQRDNQISGLTLNRHRNIFDELTARGISWTYYESPPDVTMLRMYARYAFDDQNIRPIAEFFPRAQAGQLPSVTFIDPNFHFGTTNDDHPPTSVMDGQQILQDVVEALQANAAAWNNTLFIFTYDEHGSIFDHVPPVTAETIEGDAPSDGSPITIRYGVRVPTIVVSPWVEKVCAHQVFDHCSILKTILARFCPDDPPILSDRVAFATDLGPLLTRSVGSEILGRAQLNQTGKVATGTPTGGSGSPTLDVSTKMQIVGQTKAPTTTKVAPAPLPRMATLSQPNADWHSIMARLAQLVRPA